MKTTSKLLAALVTSSLLFYACTSAPGKREKEEGNMLGKVDTLAYAEHLDAAANAGEIKLAEAEIAKEFVEVYGGKRVQNWTYAEVLRRAQGRSEMINNGLLGEVSGFHETNPSPGDSIVRFAMSIRCKNMLPESVDVFSAWIVIRNAESKVVYSTTYLTNVQPLAAGAWSAYMPFEFPVSQRDQALVHALRAIAAQHSAANFDAQMAYAKFSSGPTVDEYWLDPAH